jgi:molybdopterin-guanine dinucleotide biosynthesis protein A
VTTSTAVSSATPEPTAADEAPVGVVLAGGGSRRMGTDKALLGPVGDTLVERAVRALRGAGAAPVVCVGGDRRALARVADSWLPDDRPGAGPLAALASAMRRLPGRSLLVSACDLPSVRPEALAEVAAALAAGAPVVVPVVGGRRQWSLFAVAASATPVVLGAVTDGERSLHRALDPLAVEVRPRRPELLADADEPADLPPADRPVPPTRDPQG